MPVKVTLFGGGPKSRPNYQLTALGKTKAENFSLMGIKGEIVTALENIGPCTLSELANEVKVSPAKIKNIMQVLVRDGWAMKVNSGE